ncbi:MAG: ribosomal-processing cysteine protease Prp [Lachnospiraceae bacterium]|nr:ribosomal-processing cysteine protease Prp [Lachnospiraceae bacterium]
MTKVIIDKTADGEYKGFSLSGHAGFASKGKDIVCAAISMLVINTINSMEELSKEKMETIANEKAGRITCRFKEQLSEGGSLLMDSMMLGLTYVEQQYGKKYLSVEFKEV